MSCKCQTIGASFIHIVVLMLSTTSEGKPWPSVRNLRQWFYIRLRHERRFIGRGKDSQDSVPLNPPAGVPRTDSFIYIHSVITAARFDRFSCPSFLMSTMTWPLTSAWNCHLCSHDLTAVCRVLAPVCEPRSERLPEQDRIHFPG